MAEPENQTKTQVSQKDPSFAIREYRMHLRALNTQLNTFSGIYQLAGEYAALCEQLLLQLQAKEPDHKP